MAAEPHWQEQLGIFIAVLGFLAALFSANAITLYIISFLCGLIFGRTLYRRKHDLKDVFIFWILCLFIGLAFSIFYANLRVTFVLLLAGIALSYWLHERALIRTADI